jgi:hypothetical protein
MRRAAAGIAFALAAAGGAAGASATPAAHATPLFAPYKDVTRGLDAQTLAIHDHGAPGTLIWAFATGACGDERWGDFDSEAFARRNVARALAAGRRYIVSTGGALGIFTCGSAEAFARFAARYDSPLLAGFDFDIEGAQTPAEIRALVASVAPLAHARPALRISFTLATHAGSDRARRGLNATGRVVLAALREQRLQRAVINLMVMNYGQPSAKWCVLARRGQRAGGAGEGPRCDMGRSALQAVRNLRASHGLPASRIAVTAMVGENDVEHNVFAVDDAKLLSQEARRLGLEGLHYWSLDRDRPCPADEPRVSPDCHALSGLAPGAFGGLLAPH